jgi:hypothetical protein
MVSTPTPMAVEVQWNENEMQLINEWMDYGDQILNMCLELKQRGETHLEFPKHPKQHIKDLLFGVKEKKPRLSGIELHRYLIGKVVDSQATAMPALLFLNGNSMLDDMTGHLKSGYEHIRQKNSQILGDYVDYGTWLNAAYTKFEDKKLSGCIKISWGTWLVDNVGIRDSYARKLRVIAKLCEGYPKMRKLGVPMTELYALRKEISELLSSNVDNCAIHWKGC